MSLTADERTWLRRYKAALDEQFPGLIEELLLYGSKARGDDHPESDLDILIITGDTDFKTQHSMRWVGYMLAAMSSALPSIMVYTRADWERSAAIGSPFVQAKSSRMQCRYEPGAYCRRMAAGDFRAARRAADASGRAVRGLCFAGILLHLSRCQDSAAPARCHNKEPQRYSPLVWVAPDSTRSH